METIEENIQEETMECNGIIFYKKIVKGYVFYYPKEKHEKFDAKKYYKDNKHIIRDKQRIYEDNNKEIIYARGCKEFICECGSTIIMRSKSGHLKSKKHLEFLESKQ